MEGKWSKFLKEPKILKLLLKDDGSIPNSRLPLVVYAGALQLPIGNGATLIEDLFCSNLWGGTWRNGVYSYHHYHSTAHEVLGCYGGSATVQFGGEQGITQKFERGDVVIIPAGVGHKNLGASDAFGVVGGYPVGQEWDMNYGKKSERPRADANIRRVKLPQADPVYGRTGPLLKLWR